MANGVAMIGLSWAGDTLERMDTCMHGHPQTPENVYVGHYQDGSERRRCKPCTTAQNQRARDRRAEGKVAPRGHKEYCSRGHLKDDANTYIHPKSGWRLCIECRRLADREPARTTKRRAVWRKHKYGMSPKEYSDLLVSQDGLCAVCYQNSATAVDHNHKTGKIRGLLCGPCNRAIGLLRDDPEVLESAADYLRG